MDINTGPLLKFTNPSSLSIKGVINEIIEGKKLPKKVDVDALKRKAGELAKDFLIKTREMDSLEPPFEYYYSKVGEKDKDMHLMQLFFLTVCVFFGGKTYTKKQNTGKSKKTKQSVTTSITMCVDLMSFPNIKSRLPSYEDGDNDEKKESDGDEKEKSSNIFLCCFPNCRIKKGTDVFVFNDPAVQKELTNSSREKFAALIGNNRRKNFFRHLGTHFIGIKGEEGVMHDYRSEFEIFKIFFPHFCLSVPSSYGKTEAMGEGENLKYPFSYPDVLLVEGKDNYTGPYEINTKGFVHYGNQNFDFKFGFVEGKEEDDDDEGYDDNEDDDDNDDDDDNEDYVDDDDDYDDDD